VKYDSKNVSIGIFYDENFMSLNTFNSAPLFTTSHKFFSGQQPAVVTVLKKSCDGIFKGRCLIGLGLR